MLLSLHGPLVRLGWQGSQRATLLAKSPQGGASSPGDRIVAARLPQRNLDRPHEFTYYYSSTRVPNSATLSTGICWLLLSDKWAILPYLSTILNGPTTTYVARYLPGYELMCITPMHNLYQMG